MLKSRPDYSGCLLWALLIAALVVAVVVGGCNSSSPTDPSTYTALTVTPYGTASVDAGPYPFNPEIAATYIRLGYSTVMRDAPNPSYIANIKLTALLIRVVADAPGTSQPSSYIPDVAYIEPNHEALLQGIIQHRLCNQIHNDAPGCHWSTTNSTLP